MFPLSYVLLVSHVFVVGTAAFLLSVLSPIVVTAIEPLPRALSLELIANKNTDTVIPLRANIPIPDFGEVNWPVEISADSSVVVKSATVTIDGLWHEQASDLE